MRAHGNSQAVQENIPETKKYPLSFQSKEKVIKKLKGFFKAQKIRGKGLQNSGMSGFGGKKFLKSQLGSLCQGPFDTYVFTGDDWSVFIEDIFSRIQNHLLESLEAVKNINDQLHEICELSGSKLSSSKLSSSKLSSSNISQELEDEISPEELEEGLLIVSKYLDAMKSLAHDGLQLVANTNQQGEFFFKRYAEGSKILDSFSVHPISRFIKFNPDFHYGFIQYIIETFLDEKRKETHDKATQIKRLSQQASRTQETNRRTIELLNEAIKRRSCAIISPLNSPDTARLGEVEKENSRLQDILRAIGYDEQSASSPEKWLIERDTAAVASKSFEWECFAVEESRRVEQLKQTIIQNGSYISFLEHRLNRDHTLLAMQYAEERWNNGVMEPHEMMEYLASNPIIAESTSSCIIESIEYLHSRIGRCSLSSTANSNVGIGSGHMANIVIVPLLNFIKKHIKNGDYEYLSLGWKKIVENYIKDMGWRVDEGNCSVFSSLGNQLPSESGNMTNIESLTVGLRGIEVKYTAELKGLCEILTHLFQERMNVLRRQILSNKNGKISQ